MPEPSTPQVAATPARSLADQYQFEDFSGQTPAAEAVTGPVISSPPAAASPAAPATAPAAPPAAAATPAPKHPSQLLAQAAEFGIGAEEANGFSTEQLHNTVWRLVRQGMAGLDARANAHATHQALERPTPPAAVATAAAPAPPADAPVDLGLTEGDWEPALVAGLKKAATFYEPRLKALEARIEALSQHAAVAVQEQANNAFDQTFRGLTAYHDRIGSGDRHAIKQEELERRKAILNLAASLAGPAAGQAQVLAKAGEAARILYGDGRPPAAAVAAAVTPALPAAPEPIAANGQPPPARGRPRRPDGTFMTDEEIAIFEQWRDGGVARPTQRVGSPEPNGVPKAVQSVSRLLGEFQAGGEGGDAQRGDFLPGGSVSG